MTKASNSSRVHKTSINIIFSFIFHVVQLVSGFVLRTFFIRYLGLEYLGLNGLFINVISILSITELGIGTAMLYTFYKPINDNDRSKLQSLLKFYAKLYRLIALVVFVLGIALLPFLKIIIGEHNISENIYLIFMLYVLNSVSTYLYSYKISLFNADQRLYIVNIYDTIVSIVKLVCLIIVLVYFPNYILYMCVFLLFSILRNIILSHKVQKQYKFDKRMTDIPDLSPQDKKDIFDNVKGISVYKISLAVVKSIDNIVITLFIGLTAVGLLSNYTMIIANVGLIFVSMKPSIGSLNATDNNT